MHMTFEKIDNPIQPIPEQHPAARAALMIKELHRQTIEKIDSGFVFYRTEKDGTQTDVNAEMRGSCVLQMELCDKIAATDPLLLEEARAQASNILEDLQKVVSEANKDGRELAAMLPEIGNYGHEDK